MPSSRRLRVIGLVALLAVLILFYITNGASSTHNSAFYTRTVAAINDKQAAKAREEVIAEERQRLSRIEQVGREHNAAVSAAAAEETRMPSLRSGDSERQEPLVPKPKHSASKVSDVSSGEKSVAGRKYMKDGKVVQFKSTEDTGDDGVAKVGNVGPHSSHVATGEKQTLEDERKVETALNEILRKGPIIIFSKTYCPFSKKAKHILFDLYSISPPPYVVELDEHELGPELQSTLAKTTGRRTVPNILINGKSIGGGTDVEHLHDQDKLVNTISSMGGRRIMKVERKAEHDARTEMKFKA